MGSIDRDLVISLITVWESQVVVLQLEVDKWEDELHHVLCQWSVYVWQDTPVLDTHKTANDRCFSK